MSKTPMPMIATASLAIRVSCPSTRVECARRAELRSVSHISRHRSATYLIEILFHSNRTSVYLTVITALPDLLNVTKADLDT